MRFSTLIFYCIVVVFRVDAGIDPCTAGEEGFLLNFALTSKAKLNSP